MKLQWYILIGIVLLVLYSGYTMTKSIYNKLADAIQNFEGWYEGSRSYRNNNPGNIRWFNGLPTFLAGVIGKDEENHLIFDTYQHGRDALIRQIRLAFVGLSNEYSPSMNLYEFFGKYAEGNQEAYAEYVADYLGVQPTDSLSTIAFKWETTQNG